MLQTHAQTLYYKLLLHCNDDNANASQYYVIRTLLLLLTFSIYFAVWSTENVDLCVDKKNQLDVTFVFFISLLIVA